MNPQKIYMGLPGYGWEWQIYTNPADLARRIVACRLPTTPPK
jgi:spore germination protein YaaH